MSLLRSRFTDVYNFATFPEPTLAGSWEPPSRILVAVLLASSPTRVPSSPLQLSGSRPPESPALLSPQRSHGLYTRGLEEAAGSGPFCFSNR